MLRLTVTNLKGGVGKTTLSLMLGLYAEKMFNNPVLLVDLDPQAGTTSLLLGDKFGSPTATDVLLDYLDGGSADDILPNAVRKAPVGINLFVLPADKDLVSLVSRAAPADLLKNLLDEATTLPGDTLVLIDTGTTPYLVGMGVQAADAVLVPVAMSRQTAKPTANALAMIVRQSRRLAGLVPVGAGAANWEQGILETWQSRLQATPGLQGSVVYPSIPHSKAIVKGGWLDSGVPAKALPTVEAIYRSLGFDVPLPVVEAAVEDALLDVMPGEVSHG